MGRVVRRVPADWQHPKERNVFRNEEVFKGLHDDSRRSYADEAADWDEAWQQWQNGLCESYGESEKWVPLDPEYVGRQYTWYAGSRPSPDDYMPRWSPEERTHFMMYEDTSEGTPISPAFATPEELARWLADNGASAFGGMTADYDHWLAVARGGFAPSMVIDSGVMKSGVQFAGETA